MEKDAGLRDYWVFWLPVSSWGSVFHLLPWPCLMLLGAQSDQEKA